MEAKMSKVGRQILDSVREMRAQLRGEEPATFVVHEPKKVDGKKVRAKKLRGRPVGPRAGT
jgi:hypothetical protein